MNKLHYPKTKDSLIKSFYWALIPLIIFSFYKNGLVLYLNNLINLSDIGLLLFFYLISILIGWLIALIFKDSKLENILYCLIITSTISLNTNYIIFPILLFVVFFILKYLKMKTKITFNFLALTRLFLILSLLFNAYSYLNIGEKLHTFNYNWLDIFLGHGIGGIASTSSFILIISLIILILRVNA